MHSSLFSIVWRRKVSILLIASSLILVTLWTWAFLDSNYYQTSNGQLILNDISNGDNRKNHAYLLQKLISQANRVLQVRSETINNKNEKSVNSKFLTGGGGAGRVPLPAAAHTSGRNHYKTSGIVRFVKPTKSPPSKAAFLEAGAGFSSSLPVSSQSLTLVAHRKKLPLITGESYLFEEERLRILESQKRSRNAVLDDINNNNKKNNNMDDEHMKLSSAERQTQYEHELQRMGVPAIAGIGPDTPHSPSERLIHLDLKGAPPKLSFLKRILPMLKTLGATGLLIEYEDMFPYTGELQVLSAKNAYKVDELKDFLETASMLGLTIMPLVQTFGHIEYALKLEEFKALREIPESPQSICPSQKASISFIEQMLTQVIDFHLRMGLGKNSSVGDGDGAMPELSLKFTHIHIGCDEVFRMGECEKCRQHSRNEIFLSHVTAVASFVRSHWPHLHVVIWDDMLRCMTLSEMQHSHIGSYVEPMVWVYINDIYQFIQPQLWSMYAKVFPTAWAASAFKGAFGESLMIPPIQRHLENNIRWLAVIAKEGGRFSKGFKGLALTGWQRYDHFSVLCELLPTGIPSLITSLSTVSKGYFATNPRDNEILLVLECAFHPDMRRSGHPWIELHPNSHHSQLFTACTYPGGLVYKFALRLFDKLTETQNYLQHVQEKSAWMSDYNVRHNFSSPLRVHGLTANTPGLINELTAMAREAHEIMYDVFDEHTIAEFIEQNIYPTIAALHRHIERAQSLLQRNVWPQRPLPFARELYDLNLLPNNAMITDQQVQAHHN